MNVVFSQEHCLYKYINYTLENGIGSTKSIAIGQFNWKWNKSCAECDSRFNFKYQNYCIARGLLKPYLGYNSFLIEGNKSSDLKVIVFLCTALHNQTACNHLANLCILSHHSFYKYSPCRHFLTNQASPIIYNMDQLLQVQVHDTEESEIPAITPFLYYSKGKETLRLFKKPITVSTQLQYH